MTVPYSSASSGNNARNEIIAILKRFGCESVGFMDDFANQSVLLAFKHRGRPIQLHASAKGWAQLYLKENPYTYRHKRSEKQYRDAALQQGLIAVNSILRDWIKGQMTAVECGIFSFEAVFLPHMLTHDGRPLIEVIPALKMLPEPENHA